MEFYKYVYAGGGLRSPLHPQQISKIYPRNGKANQMCPVVQLTSLLYGSMNPLALYTHVIPINSANQFAVNSE